MTTNALMELADRLAKTWNLPKWQARSETDLIVKELQNLAATQLRTAAAEGGERGLATDRREGAVLLAIKSGYKWDGKQWYPPTDSGAGRDGWLPIDSVPNGTLVMLWMPDFEMYAAAAWKGRVTWCGRDLQPVYVKLQTPLTTEGKQLWIDMDRIYPTHWQPLPLPPAPDSEDQS